ncbi:Leg1 family protein [Nitzschia inconspicua]|uniref:Leg1 family protein n=1 Tax=Nitzschia inconspicua TaxID=303405 RepID=A0A9K3KDB7_9STRA|nr:Leg1 family protein [Nitzschia inconspicua]
MHSDDSEATLKLYYFNLRALGEVIRFMLTHSRLEWEDCVVSIEEWDSGCFDKSFLPEGYTGQKRLPVLSITTGNTTRLMPESHDIAKWIAKQCEPSLLGSTTECQAKAERLFDFYNNNSCTSIVDPVLNYFSIDDATSRLPKVVESLSEMLSFLSQEIQDGPYVCGRDLTYADFAIFHLLDNLCTLLGEDNVLETAAPDGTLRAFYDKMYRLPSISGRMLERPLAGTGEVGREGSIIYTSKAPSRLEFVQTVWKEIYHSKIE